MAKKLILVTSPPACGKTFISQMISKNLEEVVYLDKDNLVPLSNVVFDVAGEERNRSSAFFEEKIRNVEYEVILDIALSALTYADKVLINAPFTREVRNPEYMRNLKKTLAQYKAKLVVVWVDTKLEVCKKRMIERNSPRDTWKLANWDEYIKTRDFSIPECLKSTATVDELIIFKNSSSEEYEESMKKIIPQLQE